MTQHYNINIILQILSNTISLIFAFNVALNINI